jgi:hypothetical protein
MINLDKIKKDATSVHTYEIRSHVYRTVIENIEVVSNGYGLANRVTFRGLHRQRTIWTEETYVDDDTTFEMEYNITTEAFNDIPFGSTIEVCLRLTIQEKVQNDKVNLEFKVTHPKHVRIISENTEGDRYRPYIKNLPLIDINSDVDAYQQYLELGYDVEKMCRLQQEGVKKAEHLRLKKMKQKSIAD